MRCIYVFLSRLIRAQNQQMKHLESMAMWQPLMTNQNEFIYFVNSVARMRLEEWKGFLITSLTAQFYIGVLSNYSILKPDLGQEFNFSESYIGTESLICRLVEMISMFMRVVGTIYLLSAKRTKLVYFVCILLQVSFYALISLGHYLPNYAGILFMVGMIGQGLARGSYALPYILAYDAINGRENKLEINIWSGLFPLGTAWAILLASWMLNGLGWSWELTQLAYNVVFLLTGILTFLFIKEVDMPSQNEDTCESIKFMFQFFFRRQTSNIFVLFDFTFQENMVFLLIYWMPYYFTLNNFGDSSIYILIVFPVFTSVGSFFFNLMVNKCCPSYDSIATSILMALSFCASLAMCFIGTDPQDVFLYFVLLALVSAFLALPYSKVCSTDISDRVQNAKQNYIAVNGMRIFRQLQVAISLFVASIAIEAKPIYFLYFVAFNAFVNMIIHIAKRVFQMRENQHQGQERELIPNQER